MCAAITSPYQMNASTYEYTHGASRTKRSEAALPIKNTRSHATLHAMDHTSMRMPHYVHVRRVHQRAMQRALPSHRINTLSPRRHYPHTIKPHPGRPPSRDSRHLERSARMRRVHPRHDLAAMAWRLSSWPHQRGQPSVETSARNGPQAKFLLPPSDPSLRPDPSIRRRGLPDVQGGS